MADLPEAVAALSEPMQRAWTSRASGGRWKDAAAAAGVPVSTVWHWARRHKAFREALEASYLPLEDDHRDVLASALDTARQPEADDRALDRGLRAAMHVSKGLGIGAGLGAVNARAHATTVDVRVTLDLGGLVGGDHGVPAIDCTPVGDAARVDETQPRRSRSSSRRVPRGGSAGSGE